MGIGDKHGAQLHDQIVLWFRWNWNIVPFARSRSGTGGRRGDELHGISLPPASRLIIDWNCVVAVAQSTILVGAAAYSRR